MLSASVLLAVFAAAAQGGPVILDNTRQLFLDDYLIASMENVSRVVHPAEKSPANPVLWPREPWEGKVAIVYGSVLRDEGRFRMWYHGEAGVSYAESDDGIAWTRPGLGLYPVGGQNTNIVIKRGAAEGEPNLLPYFYELFGVHRDERATDPERQYVMGFLSIQREYAGPNEDPFHKGERRGLGVATSPDGIHWTLRENFATDAICDGGTYWMLDPAHDAYVLYGRTKYIPEGLLQAWGEDEWVKKSFWGRAVARVQSPDFLQWDYTAPATAPVVMTPDAKDAPGTEIYSLQVFPYEGVYIGLVQVFHNQADACHLDVQLAVSRDGVAFTRVGDCAPFIPVGPVATWDRFNTSVANNPPVAVNDELRFYYGGRTYRHSPYAGPDKGTSGGGIGFASIQRDRFVSLKASFEGGVIETVPVAMAGTAIHVNAANRFGTIEVEVLDAQTRLPVAGAFAAQEDALDIPLAWKDGTAPAKGTYILRITLRNAGLYALWCE